MIYEKNFFVIYVLVFISYQYVHGLRRYMLENYISPSKGVIRGRNDDLFEAKNSPYFDSPATARIKDHPYVLVISMQKETKGNVIETTQTFICGAILITSKWALLPAHCAIYLDETGIQTSKYNIYAGIEAWSGDKEANITQTEPFKLERLIIHPNYRGVTHFHDIALIKSTGKMQIIENVRPACLFYLDRNNPDNKRFDSLTTIGFGRKIRQATSRNKFYLQKMDGKQILFESQDYALGDFFFNFYVQDDYDNCFDDKNMALISNVFGYEFVVGMFSYFDQTQGDVGCTIDLKLKGGYLIYTKLSQYFEWIIESIDEVNELCMRSLTWDKQEYHMETDTLLNYIRNEIEEILVEKKNKKVDWRKLTKEIQDVIRREK